jgi:arylsulfatase A-like enzyme
MEPHSPYAPAAAIRQMFPARTPPLLAPPETIPEWIAVDGSRDARFYEALYDGRIRETDEALGAFFDGLRARTLLETSIIVVTSDHGEEFFEHGGFEHNRTLYDEMLRVPLIVRAPGLTPGIRDAQTQSVDLLPTLAASAGLTVEDLHGTDAWPVLRGNAGGRQYAVSELVGTLYALRTRDWKLISTLAGSHELYDLRQDPRELRNVYASELDRTVQFRNALMKIVASSAMMGRKLQGRSAPINPRVLERLKALGYVR